MVLVLERRDHHFTKQLHSCVRKDLQWAFKGFGLSPDGTCTVQRSCGESSDCQSDFTLSLVSPLSCRLQDVPCTGTGQEHKTEGG